MIYLDAMLIWYWPDWCWYLHIRNMYNGGDWWDYGLDFQFGPLAVEIGVRS